MVLLCRLAELRGIAKRTNQDGTHVFLANFEDVEGTPFQLFLGSSATMLNGCKKGDKLDLRLDYIHSSKGNFLKLIGVGTCE